MSRSRHTVRPCNRRWWCSVSRDSRGCCRALHCLTIPIECSFFFFFSCRFNYWSMITLRPSSFVFLFSWIMWLLQFCWCGSIPSNSTQMTSTLFHEIFSFDFANDIRKRRTTKSSSIAYSWNPVSGEALVACWRSWKSNSVASSFPKVKKVEAKWKGRSHSISASQVKKLGSPIM